MSDKPQLKLGAHLGEVFEKTDSIDKVFEDMHDFEEKKLPLHLATGTEAHDKFYATFKKGLEKKGISLDKKVAENVEQLREIYVESALKYFEIADEGIFKGVKNSLKKMTPENKYQRIIGVLGQLNKDRNGRSIMGDLINSLSQNKESKISDLIGKWSTDKSKYAQSHASTAHSQYFSNKVASRYHPIHVANHMKDKIIPGTGDQFKISDDANFYSLGHQDLFNVYKGVTKGDWGQGKAGDYGISQKVLKKKEVKNDYELAA